MSLPTAWIDKIFDKLTLVYGQSFLRRWADIDLNAVKSDWGHELSGFENFPAGIAYALENLPPDRPPTVLEFRAIGRRAPVADSPRLEPPRADPDRIARELEKLKPTRAALVQPVDHRAWARRIVARADSGDRISYATLKYARQALAAEPA